MFRICAFPKIAAKTILEKYPLSIKRLGEFMENHYTDFLESKEAEAIMLKELRSEFNLPLLTIYSDARKLYDFFDSYGIKVFPIIRNSEIHPRIITETDPPTDDIINVKIFDQDLSLRANAELTGFDHAFGILEQMLIE